MATTRTFQDMLNEYLPDSLLKEELIKRDYVMNRVEKDQNWKGGQIIVPFKAAGASSLKFGGLTDSTDIARSKYVRGTISSYKEAWGSMIFDHTDLLQHDGKIKESTFLRVLPDTIEDFMEYMKMAVSIQLGGGPHFATALTDGQIGGTITVDRIDRFCLDQKVGLDDDDSALAYFYVIAIDLNTDTLTLSATRAGAAADISAYTVLQNAKFYLDGVTGAADVFTSIKGALLSAANGGLANLHGQSKVAYPFLQAINISGAAITATNILEQIFDAYVSIRTKARGNANEVLMSYKHLGSVMKLIEVQKGGFKVSEGSEEASEYGWTKIEITCIATSKRLTFVGIQELDDDIIMFLDWSGITFRSNGMFKKRTAPDGKQYFEVRATTGYAYILDIALFGELQIKKPGNCGIIYGISY